MMLMKTGVIFPILGVAPNIDPPILETSPLPTLTLIPHMCSESRAFSDLARDLISQLPYDIQLPDEGTVFDFFLDLKMYRFIPWEERKPESKRSSSSSGYIVLPEVHMAKYIQWTLCILVQMS